MHWQFPLVTAALMTASQVWAGNNSMNLMANASVLQKCILGTSAVAFASYDPLAANATTPSEGIGSLQLACTKGATPSVSLSAGTHSRGSNRRMSNGSGKYIYYQLFQNSDRSLPWNDTDSKLKVDPLQSRQSRTFQIYGRIPAGQQIPAGSYSDTVMAVVEF